MPAGSGPGLGALVLITALLGGLYAAVSFFMRRRRAGASSPAIEILSSKRIGGKHQLLLVRALGQDHLLSINAGHTERICTSPTEGDPGAPGESVAQSGHPSAPRGSEQPPAPARQAPTRAAPRLPSLPTEEEAVPFGAQLLTFVQKRSRVVANDERPAAARRPSDAIAGLLELRDRARDAA